MADPTVARKTYLATVTGNALSVSRDKKTPSIRIKLQTMYETSDISKPVVFTAYGDLWLTYASMERTVKTLHEVFGWQGNYITDFQEPILVGKKVEIVGVHGEYNGKPTFDISFFNKPGGMQGANVEELASLIADVQPMLNEILGVEPTELHDDSEVPINDNYDSGKPESDIHF